MKRTHGIFIVTAIASACGAGCAGQPKPAPLDPSNLGYLEHRGQRYELSDLMDPEYRAAAENPFARNFDADLNVANHRITERLRAGSR